MRVFLFCFLSLVAFFLSPVLWAAPYGEDGMEFNFTQPSGKVLTLKAFGDEFYAVMKTVDGFPVLLDKETQTVCYSEVSADGTQWISSGIAVSAEAQKTPRSRLLPTQALNEDNKTADLSLEARKALIRAQQEELGTDEKGRSLRFSSSQTPQPLTSPAQNTNDGTVYYPPSRPTLGKVTGLTVLVQFKDTKFSDYGYNEEDLRQMFNQRTGFRKAGEVCSVREFFLNQSGGKIDYTQVCTPIITLDNNQSYYDDKSAYSSGCERFKTDLAQKLKTLGLDLSSVSTVSDNSIQALNIIYAGKTKSTWSSGLWPHKSNLYTRYSSHQVSGLWLGAYQISHFYTTTASTPANEIFRTVGHESGHLLCDFPDLYSYTSNAAILSTHCLMGGTSVTNTYPSPLSAYLRYKAGWATIVNISASDNKRLALDSSQTTFLRFKNPSRPQEYFLFEWRGDYGYEYSLNRLYSPVRSKGILAYHCDEEGSNTYSSVEGGNGWNDPYEVLIIDSQKQNLTTDWFSFSDGSNLPFKEVGYRGNAMGSYAATPANNTETSAFKWWTSTGKNGLSQLKFTKTSATDTVMTTEFGSGTLPTTPKMGISTTQLRFYTTADFVFGIYNQAQGSFSYLIEQIPNWLILSASQGSVINASVSKITARVDFSQLTAGNKDATLTVKNTSTGETLPLLIEVNHDVEPIFVVTPTKTFLPPSGGTTSLNIDSNLDWQVSSNSPWCVPSQSTGRLNDTVNLSISANPYSNPREAVVTLYAPEAEPAQAPQTVIIRQEASVLSISPSTWSSPATGGSVSLEITASQAWSASLPANENGFTLSALSGEGSQTLTLSVSSNATENSRSAQITFLSGSLETTVTVVQASTKKSYEDWQNQFFGSEQSPKSAWNESFSGDGIPNLIKYATGLSPLEKHGSSPSLSLVKDEATAQQFLCVTLPVNPEAKGISFHLEASSNLKDWVEVPCLQEQTEAQKLRLQDLVPLSTQSQRFLRVKIKKSL